MITLFVIGMLVLGIKLTVFACKMAWGICKALFTLAWLPLALIALVCVGLLKLALPLLLVALVVSLLLPAGKRVF